MKIFSRIKTQFQIFAENFSSVHLRLEEIVDTNNKMLQSHLNLVKESNAGILSLKKFGDQESPGLKSAFINLSDSLKEIEIFRTAMVTKLNVEFISPIKALIQQQKDRNIAQTRVKGAKEDLTDAQQKLQKTKTKHTAKSEKNAQKATEEINRAEQRIKALQADQVSAQQQLADFSSQDRKEIAHDGTNESDNVVDVQEQLTKLQTRCEKVEADFAKAQTSLKTLQNKHAEKQQKDADKAHEEIQKAENYVKESETILAERIQTFTSLDESFEKNKLQSIKDLLKVLVQEYKKLHLIGVSNLAESQTFIKEINIQTESTSALLHPIPPLNAENYLPELNQLARDIMQVESGLQNIYSANQRLYKAHLKLQRESILGIESFKKYALDESPGIQNAIETFADGLHTIESNRQAFIAQMKSQFLEPLQATMDEGKQLEQRIRTIFDMHQNLTKWIDKLQKLRTKPADKVAPGDLPEAKENVARYESIVSKHHDYLVRETHLFTLQKIETFKNCLNAILERNHQFHEQASNIIESSETLVDEIQIENEFSLRNSKNQA